MSFDLRRLKYEAVLAELPAELREIFVPLDADESTRAWIEAAVRRPQPRAISAMRDIAMTMVNLYDANGLVGAYSMRVLGQTQWRALLGEGGGRLLDVGAGDGEVTAELAPLFEQVVVTEISGPMARRLRKRGYTCYERDVALEPLEEEPSFDVVALQNVLDRTTHPLRLLDRVASLLRPSGRLIVAVPMPLRQAVLVSRGGSVDPEEILVEGTRGWEDGVSALYGRVLSPRGWRVERLSRAPYLCRGDASHPVLVLDDAIFVLRRG